MQKKETSKSQVNQIIKDFFSEIQNKSPCQVKKIKKMAMRQRIPLKENKRLFCKKCLHPYSFPKIRIKNKMKIIQCERCGKIIRYSFS